MKNILIAGGSGMIGRQLSKDLKERSYKVAILSRSVNANANEISFQWNPKNNMIDDDAITWADYVVNLAGAGIADKYWTGSRKKVLRDSRMMSTSLIVQAIKSSIKPPKGLINASAIGFYGDKGDQSIDEDSPVGKGFMAELCRDWENEALSLKQHSTRVSILRIGIVLSKSGGFLDPFRKMARFGLAGYFGKGDQYVPWIDIKDLSAICIKMMEQSTDGHVVNGVGPEPVIMKEFLSMLMQSQGKKGLLIPTPEFPVKLLLGDMSELFLNSSKVHSKWLRNIRFDYESRDLAKLLKEYV